MAFKTPNAAVTVTGQNLESSYSNYFIGLLEKIDVKEYGKITLTNIWPNISLELTSTENEFKLNYLLAVGANPNNIQLQFTGGNAFTQTNGNLSFTAPFGNSLTISKFNWTPPTAGQSVTPAPSVSGSFNSTTKTFQVVATNYQSSLASSIQQNIPTTPTIPIGGTPFPILKWGTYYGGTAKDDIKDIFISPTNIIYVLGETQSVDFPILNPFPDPLITMSDLWVAKFDANRKRVFSTYLGSPDGFERAGGIAVNSTGDIYFSGATSSSKYPLRDNTNTFNGTHKIDPTSEVFDDDWDGVISKLRADGQSLRWSSYFAANEGDYGNDVAIDQQDNVYMIGYMNWGGNSLPIQPLAGGFNQAFNTCLNQTESYIAKFNQSDALVWSTYYGGCANDVLSSCTVDNTNNLLVYGTSSSLGTVGSCNTTSAMQVCGIAGSYQQNRAGGSDAYVAKFNPLGQITWASFYGGTFDDLGSSSASGIKTDAQGDIYITGLSAGNFPLTAAGTNQTVIGGGTDAFVVRFSATGVRKWASYLGGNGSDNGHSISILSNGDYLVAGSTFGTNFPYVAKQGFFNDNSSNGLSDGFLTQYSSSNVRISSSYLGGTQKDENPVISTSGFLMAMGINVRSSPFYVRTLSGAYNDASYNGAGDGFIMTMNLDPDPCNVYPIGCRTSSILESKQDKLFSVFPNPTTDLLTINLGGNLSDNKVVFVYDLQGKLVLEQLIPNNQDSYILNLSNQGKGLYLIRMTSENAIHTEKIILN